MKWLYLIAAFLGTALPLSFLFPFLQQNGFDLPMLARQLFQNNVSAFFGVDVIVTSVVLWLFIFSEGKSCASISFFFNSIGISFLIKILLH